jgi:hypothetical protein
MQDLALPSDRAQRNLSATMNKSEIDISRY